MITLDETEQQICKLLAKLRNEHNQQAGVTDQRVSERVTSEQIDLEGIGAEMIFCKTFNLFPDLTTNPRAGGFDAMSEKGYRIDIKSTVYPNGHLLVKRSKKKGDSDFYILVVGKFPSYVIKGFVSEEELFNDWNLKSLGKEPGYAMEQKNLHKM